MSCVTGNYNEVGDSAEPLDDDGDVTQKNKHKKVTSLFRDIHTCMYVLPISLRFKMGYIMITVGLRFHLFHYYKHNSSEIKCAQKKYWLSERGMRSSL